MSSHRPLIIPLMLILFAVGPATAQTEDCAHYPDYLHWLVCVPSPSLAYGVTSQGDLAYVAANQAGLAIYTLAGRQVTSLVSGAVSAGDHSIIWNGRDGVGRTMPSGTYFARLETGSMTRSQKVMLIR